MSAKKNKSKKKPAMGSPVAGSNNKRAKNTPNGKNNNKKHPPQQAKNQGNANKKQPQQGPAQKKNQDAVKKPAQQGVVQKKPQDVNKPERERIKKPKAKKKFSFKRFSQKYNVGKILVALLLAIGIVAGAVYLVVSLFTAKVVIPEEIKTAEYKGRLEPSSTAIEMDISSQQQDILSDSVRVKGDRSAFKFFVNKEIIMDDYSDPALLEFGSVDTNECILLAFLVDENGKLIYRSLGVEPGEKISSVSLFEEVPYGKHKMAFIVNGYDPDTKKLIGTQTADINLIIGS